MCRIGVGCASAVPLIASPEIPAVPAARSATAPILGLDHLPRAAIGEASCLAGTKGAAPLRRPTSRKVSQPDEERRQQYLPVPSDFPPILRELSPAIQA